MKTGRLGRAPEGAHHHRGAERSAKKDWRSTCPLQSRRRMRGRPTMISRPRSGGLSKRMDEFLDGWGNIRQQMVGAVSAGDLRAPKNNEGTGHAFMRPMV